MNTRWIIAAAALIVLGAAISGVSAAAMHFDFARLNTGKENYETVSYEVDEDFDRITIHGKSDDIELLPSEDGACRVLCRESERIRHEVTAENGTLLIESFDERTWLDFIGVQIGGPKITVYLPAGAYDELAIETNAGDVGVPSGFSFESAVIRGTTSDIDFFASAAGVLEIRTTTGDINLSSLSAGELRLSAATGDIRADSIACEGGADVHVGTGSTLLRSLTCQSLTSDGTTGDIKLEDVVASGTITLHRTTGDVRFEHSDASSLSVRVGTGDITGTLLTDKVFSASATTGSVRVPQTTQGGTCELKATTGDILIEIG